MSTPAVRIGDADRDRVMEALREHFAQGRLTRDELDERLEAALAARTAPDLKVITEDLPGQFGAHAMSRPGHLSRSSDHRPAWPRNRGPWWMGHHAAWSSGYGPAWSGSYGPAWSTGRRPAWSRGRHPRPPVGLIIVAAVVISLMIAVPAWGVFALLKVAFFAWLTFMIIGAIAGRRLIRHRYHRR